MKRFLKGKGLVHGSSSSQRHVDEAISSNPKSTSRIARWPEEHNVVLAELLYEQFVHGNICNGNLRKEQWPNIVNVLNRRLSTYYTASSVMIVGLRKDSARVVRMQRVRSHYPVGQNGRRPLQSTQAGRWKSRWSYRYD
ncbi:hypothetical protein KFK09_016561 [Dendrobium nobile]|uniref:Uncharacterized protein n=1 Tax=Dendrobium nobile TaxID=94219 RepID=A0A8T3AYE9_DENNO|nr:hypothetical protein KFK09_016561 [Dendrobium nobile]